ncbi:MAG: hypothetical protein ACYDAL_14055 [Candidatus Dormibacteraceae bacterium]
MRVDRARLVVAMLAAALALGVSGTPVHADEGSVITSFNSDIIVASTTTLTIKEDIRVGCVSLWAKAFERIDTSATASSPPSSGSVSGFGGGSW